MPRIPVRTEPYTSPSRQHRHYKNKRDQVLRSLGKAAYINGSHFAIMWVSARGDVETYGSEALQGRLDDWFVKRGVADEAKELVRIYRNNANRIQPPLQMFEADEEGFEEEEDGTMEGLMMSDEESKSDNLLRHPSTSTSQRPSATNTPFLTSDADVFTDGRSRQNDGLSKQEQSVSTSAQNTSLARSRRTVPPLDTGVANEEFHRTTANGGMSMQHTTSFGMMPFRSPFGFESGSMMETPSLPVPPYSAPLRSEATFSSMANAPSLVKTTLKSTAARTAFLELRFSQLQQGMCKTVAKAWIKIIEPKKQTRCPYNKGEEGKPDWWPEGVRHKEPDHLMKPERHALLLTILRSPRVKVARLQLATAEVVALIKADKVSLLDDVYRIAREEEKMREGEVELETAITVDVSTLEGWSEDGQCIVPVDRPQSPGAAGAEGEDEGNAVLMDGHHSARKRLTAVSINRSASTSNVFKSTKRRASGSFVLQDANTFNPFSAGANANVPARITHDPSSSHVTGPRRPQGNAQTWLLHEATQHGIKRTSVSSHTLSTQAHQAIPPPHANDTSSNFGQLNHQHGLQEQYGLVTPLTGNTQLMDPSFLSAAKESDAHRIHSGRNDETQLTPGYMTAPVGHAQLFPHTNPMVGNGSQPPYLYDLQLSRPGQGQQQQSSSQENHQGPSTTIHSLEDIHPHPHNEQQQQHEQGLFTYQHPSDGNTAASGGGGGALGLHGMGGVPWHSGTANLHGTFAQNGENWWTGSAMQRMANGAMADASFDTSFASTVESGGPSTPPPSNAMTQSGLAIGMTPSRKIRVGAALIWNSQNQHGVPQQVHALSNSEAESRSPNSTLAVTKNFPSQSHQQSEGGTQHTSTQNDVAPSAFENWVYAPHSH